MSANTLDAGGIDYGKINLNGQDYYKEPLGKGAFSEVYTVYRASEEDAIDTDVPPQAIKIYKKMRGKRWQITAKEALQEARILNTRFPTEVYQLNSTAEAYTRLTEQTELTDKPVLLLMPKFPGQPILSPTGEIHPQLAKLTPLQRLQLAALVVKTLMELSVDFTDLKPENILIDIQIDDGGNAFFGCYPIDFGGYGRTVMTAAPEWNGFNSQCEFFLVPELNQAVLQELPITENAVILSNDNCAHFIIAGKLDEKTIVTNINRQGLKPCENTVKLQNLQASRIIVEAVKKSDYGLGNHDKTMEFYSVISVLAPVLGETNVYKNKNLFSKHQIKNIKEAPFWLENMRNFLLAIIAEKKKDLLLTHAIHRVIRTLEAMQNIDPEQRPDYEAIYSILVQATSLLEQSLAAKVSVFEDEILAGPDSDYSGSDSSSGTSDSEKTIVEGRQSLPPENSNFWSSASEPNLLAFFQRSFSAFSSFSDSDSNQNTPNLRLSSVSDHGSSQNTPDLKHRKLVRSPIISRLQNK